MNRRVAGIIAFVVWTLANAGLMIRDYCQDPPDPARFGTARYGHNGEGTLTFVLAMVAVECVLVLVTILVRSRVIAAMMLVLGIVWTMLSAMWLMQAGSILNAHALWVLSLDLILVVVIVTSRAKRRFDS